MPSTDFLPFATGAGANVESQSSYAGSGAQTLGFSSGLAQSAVVNKAIRQASFIAAVIAQFEVNQLGINISDDGNLANAITNFTSAIWKNAALTGVPTGPTPATGDSSTKLSTTAYVIAEVLSVLGSSPALGGNPTAPTQGTSDNSTKIASTAFVQALLALLFANNAPVLTGNTLIFPAIGSFPGFIFQFGLANCSPGSNTVALAATFPNAALGAWAIFSGSPGDVGIGCDPPSSPPYNTLTIWSGYPSTAGVRWFAIGY